MWTIYIAYLVDHRESKFPRICEIAWVRVWHIRKPNVHLSDDHVAYAYIHSQIHMYIINRKKKQKYDEIISNLPSACYPAKP